MSSGLHRSTRSRLPLVVGGGVGVVLVLAVVLGAALYQGKGLSQEAPEPLMAVSQSTPDPRTVPTPETPARLCQRDVTQALGRVAQAMLNRADTGQLQAQEFMRLDPLAYEAYTVTLNDFMTRFAENQYTGSAQVITSLLPRIQKVCSRAR